MVPSTGFGAPEDTVGDYREGCCVNPGSRSRTTRASVDVEECGTERCVKEEGSQGKGASSLRRAQQQQQQHPVNVNKRPRQSHTLSFLSSLTVSFSRFFFAFPANASSQRTQRRESTRLSNEEESVTYSLRCGDSADPASQLDLPLLSPCSLKAFESAVSLSLSLSLSSFPPYPARVLSSLPSLFYCSLSFLEG